MQASIAAVIAGAAGVSTSAVELTIESASVRISSEMSFDSEASADVTASALARGIFSSSEALQLALADGGVVIEVESIPSPPTTSATSLTTSSTAALEQSGSRSDSGSLAGIVGGIAGGGVFFVILSLFVIAGKRRKRRDEQIEQRDVSISISDRASLLSELLATLRDSAGGVPRKEVMLKEELGRGTFGTVYRAAVGSHAIAVKEMRVTIATQREGIVAAARREARLLERAEHPNVIQVHGCIFDDPHHIYLLMELASGGSLRAALDADRVPSAFEQQSLATEIALGMAYLHGLDPPILHHDLKSDNVLLALKADGSRQPRIADFGLATGTNMSKMKTQTADVGKAGTQAYKAPECFDNNFTTASDVYAFAVILWELMTADTPWDNLSDAAIVLKVYSRGERPSIPRRANRGLALIAGRCWAQSPADRPSFSELFTEQLTQHLVGPEFWCITREDLDEFEEQVQEAHQRGDIQQNALHHDPNHDDPQIGPNMHNVVQYVVKTQTTSAGVGWALMKHRGGLKVDIFVTHCWNEGV